MKRLKMNYANLVSKDAKSRLITFLKEWANKEGKESEQGIVIENYLTQTDIAQLICTARQTATLLLNELTEEGKIIYGRREIIIPNLNSL
jgi:CRP/FNR family transcriptional regulator